MDLESLIDGMSDPEAYPHPVQSVELRQTHISLVFLTDELVYKIRKPVKFSFLDFSSLSQRQADCEREVELNHRLAPDVYLGVVPVAVQDGQIRVEGAGAVVEWAVKMRRLPAEATLESRLQCGDVDRNTMTLLAQRLAAFHGAASGGPEITRFCQYAAVAHNIQDNLEAGRRCDGTILSPVLVARLTKLTSQRLEQLRAVIERRAERGVPRDTHGDLRLDHVYVFPDRQSAAHFSIIDCIEFNDALRYADPVSDIAFLIMDLKFHGRSDLASILADEYFKASGDEEGRLLLPLYVSYRATVRAKVELLELAESEIPITEREAAAERARAHWMLALSELEIPARRPCLILTGGLPGTGKSTLARGLGEIANCSVLRTDVVRKELAATFQSTLITEFNRAQIYTTEWTDRTYSECLRRTVDQLQQGQRVIVDGTFSREADRHRFLDAARRMCVPGLFFVCQADPQVVQVRLGQRTGDASDADWAVYQAAVDKWQPMSDQTARVTTVIDSGQSARVSLTSAARVLANRELLEPLSGAAFSS